MRSSTKEESEDDAKGGAKKRKPTRANAKAHEITATPKNHHGCSNPKRVLKNIELGRSLMKKLDAEKGIEGNVLCLLEDNNMRR